MITFLDTSGIMAEKKRIKKVASETEITRPVETGSSWYSRFIQKQSDGSYYFVFNAREIERQKERRMVRVLTLAEDAMQRRDYATASRYYKKFLGLDASQSQVYIRLAMAELQLGNTEAAIENAETARELNPESVEAGITLGACHSGAGNYAFAESLFLAYVDDMTVAHRVHFELGLLYKKWHRLDKALDHLLKAAEGGPPRAELYTETGQVLFELERFNEAAREFQNAIMLKPTDSFSLNCLAVTHSVIGNFDEAMVTFQTAIQIDPENAELRNNLGLNYSHQKKYKQAAECFREAVRLNENELMYHLRLARILAVRNDFSDALTAVSRCLDKEPSHIEALILCGDILLRLRRFEDAIDHYDRAIIISPCGDLYRKIGNIRLKLAQSSKAKECFLQAARIEPESVLNLTCMGFVALLENELDTALRLFTKAVEMDPLCDEAYVGLSRTRTEFGDLEEAESAIKTAIHCSPNNVDALVHYALIREKLFDSKTAIRCYERALSLDPANVEALVRYAIVLQMAGKRPEALEQLKRAIEWNPSCSDAHYYSATWYIQDGRLGLGLIHTRELFSLQPGEQRRFINIAMTLEQVNALDKAIEVYKRVTDIDPECAEAYYHIGRLAYEGGLLKLSMEVQEKLNTISPEFSRLLKKFRDQSLPAVDIAYVEGSSRDLVSST